MTPAVVDAEIAAAGGPAQLVAPESDLALSGEGEVRLRYGPFTRSAGAYRVLLAPARLTAAITATDEGHVARCLELESLGYGATAEVALADLVEATCQYLTVLAEERPKLAPQVAHHERYVRLLDAPAGSWFASVNVDAPDGE